MENDKEITVPNINNLSEIFLETLKDISKSGTKLNVETFSRFLAKKRLIKDLLKMAKDSQKKRKRLQINTELQMLQSQLENAEENKKQVLKDLFELKGNFGRERDFNKRVSLILMNLSRISGNESFFELLDNYKQLIIDEADISNRENAIDAINNRLLQEDLGAKKVHHIKGEEEPDESKSRPTVFRRVLGHHTEIKLKPLKKACLKALNELKSTLGYEFEDSISSIEQRINECENVDYLLSQRKQVIEIIHDYIRHVEDDRKQITNFIKEISKRLIDMEEIILYAFTYSSKSIEEDFSFNEKLEKQIKDMEKSVDNTKNFEDLRALIISELSAITRTLDEKRKEYKFRVENANKEKEKLQKHFEDMINNVIEQNKTLIEQNQKDSLTGIFNRMTFEDFITIEFQRYQRYLEPFSLIMFDIDYFKKVNDTYGHEAGDRVLEGIARCIEGTLRKTDVFARYGGEEFIVLMPNTDLDNSLRVAKKLREVVQDTEFLYEGQKVPITISVGITEVNPADKDIITMIGRVDGLMYKAKEGGRNTVISDSDVE